MPPTVISIFFNEDEKSIIIEDNKLYKSTIVDTFGVSKPRLSCVFNGKECFLPSTEQYFILIEEVTSYTITQTESKNIGNFALYIVFHNFILQFSIISDHTNDGVKALSNPERFQGYLQAIHGVGDSKKKKVSCRVQYSMQ